MEIELKYGLEVVLRSGGPKMVVENIIDEKTTNPKVLCQWKDELGKTQRYSFKLPMIMPYIDEFEEPESETF